MENRMENEKWSSLVSIVSSAGYEFRYEGVLEIRSVHRSDPRYRGETRKGMNADGTGKVFDGLWDRGHVEGRLYNFP